MAFQDNVKSLVATAVIVVVILLESAVDNALFECPCRTQKENVGYAVLFILAPSLTLFIVGE